MQTKCIQTTTTVLYWDRTLPPLHELLRSCHLFILSTINDDFRWLYSTVEDTSRILLSSGSRDGVFHTFSYPMVHLDNSSQPHALFYAVRTLLFILPWGFFFCRESCPFCRESFPFWIFSFLTRLKKVVQTIPNWTPDEDKCVWFLFPSPQCNTNHIFFFFLIAQFLLFTRCRTQSIPQAGFLFRCQ